eukprot:CAMPEP_0175885222 /NCGR_PEP_ID=MMETSP0107_2-20121207/44945_1 /TAXON_ID=195067 ORGANISM="Goniomonas pacifica, Strain CCMP1869" /NCGR_SAMPLE_ID=MMETSP0107_2 /ASSEMBLY_ACC=CAM_ASM_000203 /LENGTH=200 /DNA_ID=CAMNT_0017205437 /DNA_START=42 /DNA_END=647 /DNA_ORIENTATION=+
MDNEGGGHVGREEACGMVCMKAVQGVVCDVMVSPRKPVWTLLRLHLCPARHHPREDVPLELYELGVGDEVLSVQRTTSRSATLESCPVGHALAAPSDVEGTCGVGTMPLNAAVCRGGVRGRRELAEKRERQTHVAVALAMEERVGLQDDAATLTENVMAARSRNGGAQKPEALGVPLAAVAGLAKDPKMDSDAVASRLNW